MKIAFSTVACPDWTLTRVAEEATLWGYDGVELRTMGDGGSRLACDPALTGEAKVRRLLDEQGVEVCSLGSSLRYDEPLRPPPPLGYALGDYERPVRESKPVIDLAAALGAPVVRVFGFEGHGHESGKAVLRRVVDRLRLTLDACRNTGVRLAFENGGWFATAGQVREVIDAVNHPLLGACYSLAAGHAAGDSVADALATLGDDLLLARVKDVRDGMPCPPGEGDLPCEAYVSALADRGWRGWAVFEWDAAWIPGLTPAEDVLPAAAKTLSAWANGGVRAGTGA